MAKSLTAQLEPYGAPPEAVVTLTDSSPDQIRYLDLLSRPGATAPRPDAVVEMQGRPVMYVAARSDTLELGPLRRALALRADGSFLGIIEPGRLTVYTLAVGERGDKELRSVSADDPSARTVIPELALLPPMGESSSAEVRDLLFRLLDQSSTDLERVGVSPDDALSLGGRALFLRFLVDRGVMREVEPATICAGIRDFTEALSTRARIARTSLWLNRTFNGDLLPLSERIAPRSGTWFPGLSEAQIETVTGTLTKILHRAEPSGQMRLDWGDIDFAHVPVGLLSQVYERHNQIHDPSSKKQSVFYTPRTLAEYMVEEAFSAVGTPHTARILDPAAGAGVFLVAAFRKLVESRWRHDGKRPDTKTIRTILNSQLAGFEINESALRLSALSLYLTALELDPSPRPLDALKFDDLRGRVLFDVAKGESGAYVRGSLGPSVGTEHDGRYDLVIGNPPWTALKVQPAYMEAVVATIRPVIAGRMGKEYAAKYRLPDAAPDIAFFWRALQWAKPKGHIALAMHGRLLFKQTAVGRAARKDLLSASTVTGVLNGAAVRLTEIWPKVSAPFCVVFARNERPRSTDAFYFVSPEREDAMNKRGRLRIDSKAAAIVRVSDAVANPFLLKTLFRGTPLDVGVMEKFTRGHESLGVYWKRRTLACGNGFLVGGPTGRKVDAESFRGRAVLTDKSQLKGFALEDAQLEAFDRPGLERPRDERIYQAPMVLVNAAPAADRSIPRAWISPTKDLLFTESFIGYSCRGHEDAIRLAKYLFLLFNSNLWLYFALLTSSKFGVEREAVLNEDIDRLPFRPLEDLSKSQQKHIDTLYDGMLSGKRSWSAVDVWASEVYGLNAWDREVIADTLMMSAPYVSNQRAAQLKPAPATVREFGERLIAETKDFVRGQLVSDVSPGEPWTWLYIGCSPTAQAHLPHADDFTKQADVLGATQILSIDEDGIRVGILSQARYWTVTRARLLAIELVEREDLLGALQCR
jgi:hypothetical protein